MLGKLCDLFLFEWKEWLIARHFHADLFVSHGSVIASHVAWLMHKPHVTFEDTFNMEQVRLYAPFTKYILTANYQNPITNWKNVISCPMYNELLYLHPHRFCPDSSVLSELGVHKGNKYTIVRFVGWNASHDIGHKGMSALNKIYAVRCFEQFGRVYISSESFLPPELEPYRFPLSPDRMHDAIAFSTLVFGESATMASEAAVLGVPSIFVNNARILYTQEQETKYHLCCNFSESEEDQLRAIEKGVEILSGKSGVGYEKQRQLLLRDKIDVTAFFVDFIEKM